MKNFIIQLLGLLVVLLGGSFFLKGKFKNLFTKKETFEEPPEIRPLPKAPDTEKIREEFKNETSEESIVHVNDLFDELFPRD